MTPVDLRGRLVGTTVELLRTIEPTELSLRAVARTLGVSSGAPYHHFADKHELLAAVALEGWNDLNARLAATAGKSHAEHLVQMGLAYIQTALDNPAHFRVMFLPELKDAERFDFLHAASEQALGQLLTLVADALHLPLDHPDLLPRVVGSWSTVHGFAILFNSGVLAQKAQRVPAEVLAQGAAEAAVRAALGTWREAPPRPKASSRTRDDELTGT